MELRTTLRRVRAWTGSGSRSRSAARGRTCDRSPFSTEWLPKATSRVLPFRPSGRLLRATAERRCIIFRHLPAMTDCRGTNPDYRYVNLPDEINLSDPTKDVFYRQNAVVVIPGLGTPRSARTVAVPGAHVAWGITLLKDAPNNENAIKFLQLLLGPAGKEALDDNGPAPVSPALVSPADFRKLPEPLRSLVNAERNRF